MKTGHLVVSAVKFEQLLASSLFKTVGMFSKLFPL